MNVHHLHLHVNTPVLILMVVFSVPAIMGIYWTITGDLVMVCSCSYLVMENMCYSI